MAPQKKDATGLIAGPLKVIARTDRKDRDKRIIFEAECICGSTEFGALAVLGQFQGHGLNCPGHPLKKSNEKPESGFTYFPDQQPEYDVALAAWESARRLGQIKEESKVNIAADTTTPEVMTTESALVEVCEEDVVTTTEPEASIVESATTPEVAPTMEIVTATEKATTESAPINAAEEVVTTSEVTTTTEPEAAIIVETASTTEVVADAPSADNTTADATTDVIVEAPAVTQETPKAAVDRNTSTKMSAVLATRLKLTNYHTCSKKLTPPVQILGQDATSVVFAEDATGTDRVMLHICLCSADGKTKSIVSSMKKVPTDDFSTLTHTLAAMNITWRSKDQPLITVAK